MNIILTKDIDKLGNAGEIIKVKDGYARNFLIPKGFAMVANDNNLKQLEFQKRVIDKKVNKEYENANILAGKISSNDISISKKVGEEGKLFGTVTNREIADAMKAKGLKIDHRNIIIDDPIKKAGVYEVSIKLFREVRGTLKLWVVAEESAE